MLCCLLLCLILPCTATRCVINNFSQVQACRGFQPVRHAEAQSKEGWAIAARRRFQSSPEGSICRGSSRQRTAGAAEVRAVRASTALAAFLFGSPGLLLQTPRCCAAAAGACLAGRLRQQLQRQQAHVCVDLPHRGGGVASKGRVHGSVGNHLRIHPAGRQAGRRVGGGAGMVTRFLFFASPQSPVVAVTCRRWWLGWI